MRKGLAASAAAAALAGAAAVAFSQLRKHQKRSTPFDRLQQIVLKNNEGVEVHITPVGASIQRFIVPIRGKAVDIVLGFNKASTYAVSCYKRFGSCI